jgi:hypothetical protein
MNLVDYRTDIWFLNNHVSFQKGAGISKIFKNNYSGKIQIKRVLNFKTYILSSDYDLFNMSVLARLYFNQEYAIFPRRLNLKQ